MLCPECNDQMDAGYLYVRGFGATLLWSASDSVSPVSRKGVTQIDLRGIGAVPSRQQAVVPACRCSTCGAIQFKSKRSTMPFVRAPSGDDSFAVETTETR
jgi:hypothetical protein